MYLALVSIRCSLAFRLQGKKSNNRPVKMNPDESAVFHAITSQLCIRDLREESRKGRCQYVYVCLCAVVFIELLCTRAREEGKAKKQKRIPSQKIGGRQVEREVQGHVHAESMQAGSTSPPQLRGSRIRVAPKVSQCLYSIFVKCSSS